MRWTRHVEQIREKSVQHFVERLEENRPLGRLGRRLKNNIKKNFYHHYQHYDLGSC
jgi:hypothetical protein